MHAKFEEVHRVCTNPIYRAMATIFNTGVKHFFAPLEDILVASRQGAHSHDAADFPQNWRWPETLEY